MGVYNSVLSDNRIKIAQGDSTNSRDSEIRKVCDGAGGILEKDDLLKYFIQLKRRMHDPWE